MASMTKADHQTASRQRRLLTTGATIVAVVATALALTLQYASPVFNYDDMLLALLAVQPLSLLAIWLPAPRLASLAGPPATTSSAFGANALSVVLALALPGRLFEAVKPIALNLRTGLPMSRGLAAVALERLLDLGFLTILTLAAMAGAAVSYTSELWKSTLVMLAMLVIAVAVLAVLVIRPKLGLRAVRILPSRRLRGGAGATFQALGELGTWRRLRLPLLLSAAVWGASYLVVLFLLEIAGSIPLSPAEVLFVFVAGMLGFAVAIGPAGLGTYEAAIVLALGSFGYPVADALALAILLRIANMLPAVPISAWFVGNGRFDLSEIVARMRPPREK